MVKAIRIQQTGGPDTLRIENLDLPKLSPQDVLIRQTAVGVNYIDTYHRSGLYPVEQLPSGIGMEAAGAIEEVGAAVRDFAPGDRVAYATAPFGAYAEARVLTADRLIKLPPAIPDDVAAGALFKGMTVEYLIHRTYHVTAGQTVVWHAAAGGVGLIACQWLAHLGVRVIGTVGSDEKAELARQFGCAHPIVYTRDNFVQRVRELTHGQGVPVVYDSVGRSTVEGSLDCLEPRGLMVSFGNASGKPAPIDLATLAAKGSLFVTRPTLLHYTATQQALRASASALFQAMACGAVKIRIAHRWPLAAANEAHRTLESRATSGSCLLVP